MDKVTKRHRKPYTIYRMVPLSMTLSDLWPLFQGHDIFFRSNIVKKARLKDKVTIANWKLYLTYGMVLCLVTLTDL